MADDQEQSNAVDQDERTFEVVKLRIAFLQHITTLSGAAILIIFALIERAETTSEAWLLATTVFQFLLAALISVMGIVLLLFSTERVVGYRAAKAGRFTTVSAGAAFASGSVWVAFYAAGGAALLGTIISYPLAAFVLALVYGAVLLLLLLLIVRWARRRFRG